jgi:hypothetical protein
MRPEESPLKMTYGGNFLPLDETASATVTLLFFTSLALTETALAPICLTVVDGRICEKTAVWSMFTNMTPGFCEHMLLISALRDAAHARKVSSAMETFRVTLLIVRVCHCINRYTHRWRETKLKA